MAHPFLHLSKRQLNLILFPSGFSDSFSYPVPSPSSLVSKLNPFPPNLICSGPAVFQARDSPQWRAQCELSWSFSSMNTPCQVDLCSSPSSGVPTVASLPREFCCSFTTCHGLTVSSRVPFPIIESRMYLCILSFKIPLEQSLALPGFVPVASLIHKSCLIIAYWMKGIQVWTPFGSSPSNVSYIFFLFLLRLFPLLRISTPTPHPSLVSHSLLSFKMSLLWTLSDSFP